MVAKMVTCPSSSVKVVVPSVPHSWLGVSATMWPSCGLLGRASGCRLGDSNWFSRIYPQHPTDDTDFSSLAVDAQTGSRAAGDALPLIQVRKAGQNKSSCR